MRFDELGLAPEILKAVADLGYAEATPIQQQAIPLVLQGKDLKACAQTGTGKTAAFTLPLIQRLLPFATPSPSPAKHPVRALMLAPTRELALQVYESVKAYTKYTPFRSICLFGGVDIKPQIAEMKKGVEFVVATPGRLLDHVEQKSIHFNHVQALVLDEADRMLDMGFIPDIQRILNMLPAARQSLLFSATFSTEIQRLADSMLHEPILVEVARRNAVNETISHRVYPVAEERKKSLLIKLLRSGEITQTLVFVRTKQGCGRLARELERAGIPADAIHGDKSQGERIKALDAFKSGACKVLVATDVAARGLDIEDLPYVINYELPHTPEDYVHRIGRTGRAGRQGNAVSLVSAHEVVYLVDIEKLIKKQVEQVILEGYGPEADWEYPPGEKKKHHAREVHAAAKPVAGRAQAPARSGENRRRHVAADGFDFDKPYESAAAANTETPEKKPAPAANPGNPHQRKKPVVAALLGGLGR
ncbi:DEAD/DEAH box helicase [Azospira inquinata]|uniref:DEAD-box ATP-dependent RNA helicase RhpA n=1 Tax=Azospira inquinata TaxID=2785627 RepID=A0A975XV77_9RHOO|nr:DEAD/DEAH box helicase [Azospira inquinata]QWT45105.1 DEAD/DEAH box helicase [Azospira inquinata]QWT49561.1 DEAD/DEAH box helicase [Azospira inquinata]